MTFSLELSHCTQESLHGLFTAAFLVCLCFSLVSLLKGFPCTVGKRGRWARGLGCALQRERVCA